MVSLFLLQNNNNMIFISSMFQLSVWIFSLETIGKTKTDGIHHSEQKNKNKNKKRNKKKKKKKNQEKQKNAQFESNVER